ncbi:PLC-like phosphodiesterase [Myriangium duriaei CBS 260.36]|uniref:PLC-like phosphodiesterase n=1 Tax=Myriangium duriaei CBS 260.36 TaxID=1168546 RepID=A0A9P4ML66_9PEZI|nr:PLC-like phosphodiesterase [Myriangium duriaei CBS 260.36]
MIEDLHSYGTFLNEKASQSLRECQQRQRHRHQRSRQIAVLDTRSWMTAIPDETYLSALTLPGTHDSAAYGSIWPFVSTQTLSLTQQLDSGIRYMDMRCGLRTDVLEMVHGRAVLGRPLASCLEDIYSWLSDHPTEAVTLQIKQDRAPENSSVNFAEALWRLVDASPHHWALGATTPRLGHVRGRIQLLRRFKLYGPYRLSGIDVSSWQDNPSLPFKIRTRAGTNIVIQDHYNPSSPGPLQGVVDEKFLLVEAMLDLAAASPKQSFLHSLCTLFSMASSDPERDPATDRHLRTWYLNFCSAYQLNVYYQSFPHDIAVGAWSGYHWVDGVNRLLERRLLTSRGAKRRYGVVLLDFLEQPDPELVGQLVATNFGPRCQGKSRRIRATFRSFA